jgi:brefeldin A-resistance guanine nucleotide exchange factor 1
VDREIAWLVTRFQPFNFQVLNLLTYKQEEAVPESLKNVILVMSSSGYLVPPTQNSEYEKLWIETWKRIDRFLPDLRKELNMGDPTPKVTPKVSLEKTAVEPAAKEEA